MILAGVLVVVAGLFGVGILEKTPAPVVYVAGVYESAAITYLGSTVRLNLTIGCSVCPVTAHPGDPYYIIWSVSNPFNATARYSVFSVGPSPSWSGSVYPTAPFSVQSGGVQILSIRGTVPNLSGAYFIPVTLVASVG